MDDSTIVSYIPLQIFGTSIMPPAVTDDHPVLPFFSQLAERVGPPPPKQPEQRSSRRQRHSADGAAVTDHDDPEHDPPGVRRLYTVAMMADVLGAAPAAVRHWARGGMLVAAKRAGSLEWFDFQQLVVGRALVRLLNSGLSLREIDAKLVGLVPGGVDEAARHSGRIVVDGRRLSIQRGGRLLGPGGQMQFGFYTDGLREIASSQASDPSEATRPRNTVVPGLTDVLCEQPTGKELLDLAADLEATGEFVEAAEALRAFLQGEGQSAQVMFMLAELLYRSGDLTAARERYYATLEVDTDHVEARTSLGCVLAELGDHELALAALQGVLRQEPDYADAHWHLAGVLHDCGRRIESRRHLRMFLALAPESPWATLARERLR
jgi:DNA-binding transcriptional MerR regulator